MVDITLARDQVCPAAADDDPRAALVASCAIRLDSEAIADGDVDEEADEEGESSMDDPELITVDILHSRDGSEDVDQGYKIPKTLEAASAVNVPESGLGALPSTFGMCVLSAIP